MSILRFVPLVCLLVCPVPLAAEIIASGQSATVAYSASPWAGTISATDLVNTGQATLANSTVSTSNPAFSAAGVNDGTSQDSAAPGGNTFFYQPDNHFPGTVTFDLNVAVNTAGYDLTSISSFIGWATVSNAQANQTYTVAVSTVGSAAYTNLATVSYTPFQDVQGGAYETRVQITENLTGVLATGVDSIRFIFTDPLLAVPNGTGTVEGTLIRELDVFGSPTSSGPDITAPAPNPMTFANAPHATSANAIAMTATAAGDISGVEYYFTETSGNPGGNDSGWQSSPLYEDTGLTTGLVYTYTVTARDLSTNHNATAPSAPASATALGIVVTGQSATVAYSASPWAGTISTTDLVNNGQTTLVNSTVSTTDAAFPAAGVNDGTSADFSVPGGNTFFNRQGSHFPGTVTFDLNVAVNTAGYDLTSISSFIGWATVSNAQANQTYTVAVSTVGSADYTNLATVSYTPFVDSEGGNYETRVQITENLTGVLATRVDSIRFIFTDPLLAVANGTGTFEGALIRELDVFGSPTSSGPDIPPVVSVSNLAQRQIVQRSAANTAAIPITGTYSGTPDRIEARAVVMAGAANSGTSTAWTTIVAAPSGGAFSGTLANVAAGGWYQIEVRGVTGETPGATTVRDKIGVGDIFITCGQSNSANHGSPAATVADDRVSAWNYTNGAWTKATDPMPGASGGGGSAWSRLGDVLAARDNIPVAFACLGQGSTTVSQWTPANNEHYPKVRTAVQAFPVNGFRAVLWHQGESDAISSTTPANYQARMESIIAQSRTDAGWTVPWGLAEAAFHPDTHLGQEEQVVAGQRRAIFADAQVFPGPVTDDFHLEGKLSDTVHFNAAGLADHAAQWAEVLGGTPPLAPKNSNFESNTALADGGIAEINTTSSASPSVIGWRALAASGEAVADGSCGYYNPTEAWYAGADDTGGTSGIAPRMLGRHVAFLSGSAANAHFLQTRRAMLASQTSYTLTVALGVRNTADPFGGATLELLADGAVIASRAISRADLDAANGGNATGKFTDMTLTASTGSTVVSGKPLAVRIVKSGGAGTYLDFDHVRLTSALTPYASWQIDHWNSTTVADAAWTADPDGDSLKNAFEYYLGLNPKIRDAPAFLSSFVRDGKTWERYRIPLAPGVDSSGLGMWYSFDLVTWVPAATNLGGTVIQDRGSDFWSLEISATDHPRGFYRLTAGSQPN